MSASFFEAKLTLRAGYLNRVVNSVDVFDVSQRLLDQLFEVIAGELPSYSKTTVLALKLQPFGSSSEVGMRRDTMRRLKFHPTA